MPVLIPAELTEHAWRLSAQRGALERVLEMAETSAGLRSGSATGDRELLAAVNGLTDAIRQLQQTLQVRQTAPPPVAAPVTRRYRQHSAQG